MLPRKEFEIWSVGDAIFRGFRVRFWQWKCEPEKGGSTDRPPRPSSAPAPVTRFSTVSFFIFHFISSYVSMACPETTIMVKSSWDDADWIWNYSLLLYLKAIIAVVGSYDASPPPPPPLDPMLVWVGGRYVLCAVDIPTLVQGRGGGGGELISSQHFWPWL